MIDWSKGPRWAKWFAVSERGVGCWFQRKPIGVVSKKYGLRWEAEGAKEYVPGMFFENTNVSTSRLGEVEKFVFVEGESTENDANVSED